MLSAEPVSSGLCLITINTWGINSDQEDGAVEVAFVKSGDGVD